VADIHETTLLILQCSMHGYHAYLGVLSSSPLPRYPHGQNLMIPKFRYHVCYFDLDTEDYLHATPETNYISQKIVHDKLATSEDNWLSIMHDIHEQTVHNLTSYFLAQITAKGFKTVTVGECLNDPEANWYRST